MPSLNADGANPDSKGTACQAYSLEVSPSVELHGARWEVEHPQAALLIVHGYAEHCMRYDSIAQHFNNQGISVYGYDHRGHGRSPGAMGYVASFDTLVDDLDVALKDAQARVGDVPFFIWGHSMGGLLLALYTIRNSPQATGLIFSSASVKMDENTAPLLQKVLGVLATIAPRLPVLQLEADAISRIPEEVQKYIDDPLVYTGKLQARTGNEMVKATKEVQQNLSEIQLPFLAMHGTADRIVKSDASQLLYDEATAEDKTLKFYEGAYHEIHNDLDRDEFIESMTKWIEAHCTS